jgi:hypothetical protein
MSWPIIWPGGSAPEGTDPALIARAEKHAANSLRFLTLYRVGGDPITVMPCGRSCRAPRMRQLMFHPVLLETGQYANCWCSDGCGCGPVDYVELTAPVGRIDEVKIDGVVLDPTTYHVEDGNKLVRLDKLGWPPCGGKEFTVTYLNSYPVDDLGQFIGGLLADEFLKAMTSKKCRLPSSVTNVTRQGLSFEVTRGMFTDGATGVPEVDAYVLQWNPHGLRTKPGVYSIDRPAQRQVTWQAPA